MKHEYNEIVGLLTELRDLERQHLAEYRRISAESLEMQRRAVARQEEAVKFSKNAIIAVLAIVICLSLLLLHRFSNK